ncbi:MAG: biotin/lipoyl-containing protein, partial [Aeromicrobium sp.]
AFRNVPSQPRVRTFEPDLEVEYSSVSGRLAQSQIAGLAVVSTARDLVVLDDDGVIERFAVAVQPEGVDVDGPDGSFSFVPVPTFVDPADIIAEGSLLAPMPAAVVTVAVTEGQQVAKGDVVVVLEAMKMQHTITAPTDGIVAQLGVTAGAQVESGTVLAVIEPVTHHEEDPA